MLLFMSCYRLSMRSWGLQSWGRVWPQFHGLFPQELTRLLWQRFQGDLPGSGRRKERAILLKCTLSLSITQVNSVGESWGKGIALMSTPSSLLSQLRMRLWVQTLVKVTGQAHGPLTDRLNLKVREHSSFPTPYQHAGRAPLQELGYSLNSDTGSL